MIRSYVGLSRAGAGNERQRLQLLEAHRELILEQVATPTRGLDLIKGKIDTYRDRLDQGTADQLWSTPR